MKESASTRTDPRSTAEPWTIGWKEYVDFVGWNIRHVKVKIDTGARTSAVDVASYDLREVAGQGLVAEMRPLFSLPSGTPPGIT